MTYSISLPFTQRRLRPTLALAAGTLLVALTCLALGHWQLRRADEKALLAERIAARAALAPLRLDAAPAQGADLAYRTVEVRGRYAPRYQFYLENRMRQGRRGVEVVTPLRLAGSETYLLVNRGWVPAPDAARSAPPAGLVTITGQAREPALPGLRLGPANSDPNPWGGNWLYTDLALFAEAAGAPALPFELLLAPQAEGGFERSWTLPPANTAMHVGYAIQWFAFGVIAVAVGVGLAWRRGGEGR